jgi:hypothetical protein
LSLGRSGDVDIAAGVRGRRLHPDPSRTDEGQEQNGNGMTELDEPPPWHRPGR